MISDKSKKLTPFHVMEVLERARELEITGKKIIHLEIGEPDFPTAPHICAAASSALWSGETKYTHSQGLPRLREAIAGYYNSKFRLDLEPGQIIITSGTSPALLLVFMGLLDAGDEVIMSDPYYACYPNFVEYLNGKPVFVRTRENNAFVLNGFSKLYAMTGWRLGYLIAPFEYIRPLQKLAQNFFICANSFVQHAGIAALTGPQDHVGYNQSMESFHLILSISPLKTLLA